MTIAACDGSLWRHQGRLSPDRPRPIYTGHNAKGDVIAAQMFMVIALRNPTEIKAQIAATVSEGEFYELKPDTWFVRHGSTTRELAEKIGVRQGRSGTGLVVSISGYSGRAPGDVWEWIKLNWETDG